jgi:DNA-binding NtrC family response regulator
MKSRHELLIFRCREDDVEVIETAAGPCGTECIKLGSRAEVLHQVATRRPIGVFLRIGDDTKAHLDVIPMIHAVGKGPPVIVVADEDSLDLERRARQHHVFYYLVHPLDQKEVKAVLDDILRHANA